MRAWREGALVAVWLAVRTVHDEEGRPTLIIHFYWIPSLGWWWWWLGGRILDDLHWPEAEAHCSGTSWKLKWQTLLSALGLRSCVWWLTLKSDCFGFAGSEHFQVKYLSCFATKHTLMHAHALQRSPQIPARKPNLYSAFLNPQRAYVRDTFMCRTHLHTHRGNDKYDKCTNT